jgi:hypothetical protein
MIHSRYRNRETISRLRGERAGVMGKASESSGQDMANRKLPTSFAQGITSLPQSWLASQQNSSPTLSFGEGR